MTEIAHPAATLSPARKWMITLSVMLITVMQMIDTSITNVALPHMQGSLSTSVEETSWVITSYLAANAIVIPATAWLTGVLGRRRLFLLSAAIFTISSFLSGLAPNLEFLVAMRILQGIGGGPMVPMAQATMWEIFPLKQRGLAMAVWGIGIMMAPIFGPTVGGWVCDNWSWRWIFYINLPIGIVGFFMASVFLYDSPYQKKPGAVDWPGLALMVVGFGALQLMLDKGEHEDWFGSDLIVFLAGLATVAVIGFVIRELTAKEPILNLGVFNDRNFAVGSIVMASVGFGFFASTVLLALYTQKLMGYDAWTSGTVLAPGGIGNMVALLISGRLVRRVDQRMLLALGCTLNAIAFYMMTNITLGMDYWALALPRFVQGFGQGFIFVPLQTLALSTVRMENLPNATSAFNVVRNFGGSMGIAIATSLLARRSQYHQATLTEHVSLYEADTQGRLRQLTDYFVAQGADTFTASRRAVATLYSSTIAQAQALAYVDVYVLLAGLFTLILFMLPWMRRVRIDQSGPRTPTKSGGRVEGLPAAATD
ncbi:MAG: DHA2 family efflux MFS transporter permease subunit [Candidatus Rokubacteria bacterium]|nr:DHA2 family efflux MFS transporter permease subunit [Candidatus Rokubacteria bacterium]